MVDLAALEQAIESGDRATAVRVAGEAIASGMAPQAILDAITQAMAVTGAPFRSSVISMPEMLIAARATHR